MTYGYAPFKPSVKRILLWLPELDESSLWRLRHALDREIRKRQVERLGEDEVKMRQHPIPNGALVTFRYSGQDDAELRMLSGKPAIVDRRLNDGTEVDESEVGRMYRLRFDEGYERDAFEDELEVIRVGL